MKDGAVTIPAVAHVKASGKSAAMRSPTAGMLLHTLGGFKATYGFNAPEAGRYAVTARVATVQSGQRIRFDANDSAHESDVPYTVGMWEQTQPVELTLEKGRNLLHVDLLPGSRGVTIKDIILTPAR